MSKITALLALGTVALMACGGPTMNREDGLRRLSDAIQAPAGSPEEAQENSRLVEQIVQEGLLEDMTRPEVQEAIGRGDPCSRHPKCAEQEFQGDDWFYTVGQMGEGRAGVLPILIVGFDRSGRVTRVWNLRVH